jgi:hypothetical protein
MSESDVAAALFTQGAKVAKGLTDDECKQLLSGEAKIGLVPRGHRVLEYTSLLDKALKALQRLSPEELQQLDDGQAKLAVLRKGEKITKPFDPATIAQAVSQLATEGEIVRYLNAESSLSTPNLKKLATVLNLPLPSGVTSKQAIQTYIAQNLVRDRSRWSLR